MELCFNEICTTSVASVDCSENSFLQQSLRGYGSGGGGGIFSSGSGGGGADGNGGADGIRLLTAGSGSGKEADGRAVGLFVCEFKPSDAIIEFCFNLSEEDMDNAVDVEELFDNDDCLRFSCL